MNMKSIGARIQELRKASGMTQEELAERLDISSNYLSNIETGRDVCSTSILLGIANLLHASVDYLLGENLAYNAAGMEAGALRAALLHEVGRMSEAECGHLLRYLRLMREENDG